MKQVVYITEPDAINAERVRGLLPADYEVIAGNIAFSGTIPPECTALIIRSATTVTSSIKDFFPNVRHIVRVGVGVDNIDVDFCDHEGIAVYNAPGANSDAVSDYVVGMMFQALRKTYLLTDDDVKAWSRFKFMGRSMAGCTIGIIGFGNIGKQIFTKLQGFHCKAFFVYDPLIKKEDMPEGVTYVTSAEEVLRSSDIVTLHVPLLPTTKYLINRQNLGLMPEGAILINASRGGIVNEADVVEHMQDHDLVYVADVIEGEPHVSEDLINAANVIITPHIAALTQEAEENILAVALDNFVHAKPMNKPSGVAI